MKRDEKKLKSDPILIHPSFTMYKGRNPSPPGGHVDFDYRSSFDAHQLDKAIDRLKAVKKKVPFADLNFIREALDKSLKVTNTLRGGNQEPDPCPEAVPESICYNHERSSEGNSKNMELLKDFKSLRMEKINDENIEDDLEATFLSNKGHEIKENIFNGSSLDHSSTLCLEYSNDDLKPRTKIQERRDSTEYRKHQKKSHREKKKELEPSKKKTYDDDLKEFVNFCSRKSERSESYHTKRRYNGRSSDDDSNSSYKRRSYSRDRRSISNERLSKKKIRNVYSSNSSPDNSPRRSRSYKRGKKRRSKDRVSRSRSRDNVFRRKLRGSSSDNSSEYSHKNRSYKKREERCRSSVSRSRSRDRRKKLGESSYLSDNSSEHSYKNRSYKREEGSKYKERYLQKNGVKAKPDTHSDSNASVKVTPKSQQDDISKLSAEDFGCEPQSARASEVIRDERLGSSPSHPIQSKLSPRSEQNDNSLDDEYLTAGFVSANTYFCKVCQKNLNGVTCYETHINGKKHKKAEENKRLLKSMESVSSDQVAKNPIRKEPLIKSESMTSTRDGNTYLESFETAMYQEKIDAHRDDPIVGLEYVDEIHNENDGTITYYCILCEAPCVQTSIFSHLIGARHCLKFLKRVNHPSYDRLTRIRKSEVQKKIRGILQAHENQRGRGLIKVKICLKKPNSSPVHGDDGFNPMQQENQFNPADYLDESGNFYCSLCDSRMNNPNMFQSHMVGKRHIKNMKKTSSAIVPSMQIPSAKKERAPNAYSKLERWLNDYHDSPIVGLNFIRETQSMFGENYTCYLCNSNTSKDILEHITSMKHQMKFLETVDANKTIPNGYKHIRELEVNEQTRHDLVEEECRQIEDKHGRGRVEVYR